MNVNLLTYHQVIFPQIQLMQSMVLSFMQRWLKLKKSVISRLNSTVEGNKNNNGATAVNSIAIGPDAKSSAVNGVSLGNNAQPVIFQIRQRLVLRPMLMVVMLQQWVQMLKPLLTRQH